ncbi:hypothetical protein LIER_40290 [Lithospermum erythrorhizon]|uniref:Uncharacterized protein n=1 Tax=Lithospermum erythrorhizon TaxID=34254 RepID=A0AAV3QWH9_LITER
MYGEDKDPLQYPLVKSLWTSTDPVKGGSEKGQIAVSVAAAVLVDDLVTVPAPPPAIDEMDELRWRCEEAEAGGGEKQSPF